MRMLCTALATICTLVTAPVLAAESTEFQISPRAGRGELELEQFRNVDNRIVERDTFGIGVSLGIVTPINVLLEAGTETYGNFDFFNADDEFTLRQHYAAIGYQLELGNGWRLVPKVGRSKWRLSAKEGRLFNIGEAEEDVQRGYEHFWEFGIGKRINDVMTLGASVRSGNYDFGDAGSVAFVMTLGF
jgi:hypothetical protein